MCLLTSLTRRSVKKGSGLKRPSALKGAYLNRFLSKTSEFNSQSVTPLSNLVRYLLQSAGGAASGKIRATPLIIGEGPVHRPTRIVRYARECEHVRLGKGGTRK